MSQPAKIRSFILKPVHRLWIFMLIWTTLVGASMAWNVGQEKRGTFDDALLQARAIYEKGILYRRWIARHGGVYAPVTEETKPNPNLSHLPERDIATPSGKRLTLVHPAHMTREVLELAAKELGVYGHITSLKLLRPEDTPDPWEAAALRSFEQGEKEVSSLEKVRGKEYLRLMKPLIAEKECLGCHGKQGYREGDLRGGISVSIPMEPLQAVERKHLTILTIAHSIIWLAGVAGIALWTQLLRQSEGKRKRAEEELKKHSEHLEKLVEERTAELRAANDRLQEDVAKWERAEGVIRVSEESNRQLANENLLIAEIGRIISSSLDTEEVYGPFAEMISRLIPFDRLSITLIDAEKGIGVRAYASGMESEKYRKGSVFPLKGSALEEMIPAKQNLILDHEEGEGRFPFLAPFFNAGVRTMMFIPLISRNRTIGVLGFHSKKARAFTQRDLNIAKNIANQIAGAIANAQLFAEVRQKEEAQKKEAQFLQTLVDTIPNPIFYRDTRGKYLGCNRRYEEVFGLTREEILGKAVREVFPREVAEEIQGKDQALLAQPGTQVYETHLTFSDGSEHDIIHYKATFCDEKGTVAGLVGFFVDISEQKRADKQIRASLREKEVLLQEIHHRVKNNMQIISSLLRLQSRHLQNEEMQQPFQECQNRIQNMALIHEKLYQSKDLSRVSFLQYIKDLAMGLYRSYGIDPEKIILDIRGQDVFLRLKTAIPCGLIINELLSNSLKHAFPGNRSGKISITLGCEQDLVTLTIVDNGVGLPADLDFRKTESLGLQLVVTLVEQLEGQIESCCEGGAKFQVTFQGGQQDREGYID